MPLALVMLCLLVVVVVVIVIVVVADHVAQRPRSSPNEWLMICMGRVALQASAGSHGLIRCCQKTVRVNASKQESKSWAV